MTETRDYNGVAEWSLEAVLQRYRELAKKLRQAKVLELKPKEHVQGGVRWIYPVMDEVVAGIKEGDRACIELGIQFIENGPPQPFGKSLHSNTARALRRVELTTDQIARLRARVFSMLTSSEVPREFSDYAKLIRHVGLGDDWPGTRAHVDETNPHVMEHVRYFEAIVSNQRAVQQGVAPDKARASR